MNLRLITSWSIRNPANRILRLHSSLLALNSQGVGARPGKQASTSPNPSFLMKRMREGDTTKRGGDSPTSAPRRVRSPKIHPPPASSGATTSPTKRQSTPELLTPRASLWLPRGLRGYTWWVRSRAPTVRTTIYLSTTTTEPGNESVTPSQDRGLLMGSNIWVPQDDRYERIPRPRWPSEYFCGFLDLF
jgi:hypothetical protein